ncbi:MAG: hypothetical protein ACOX5Z_03185 [Desulfobulbus sp.]|jgi:hypothetical protein
MLRFSRRCPAFAAFQEVYGQFLFARCAMKRTIVALLKKAVSPFTVPCFEQAIFALVVPEKGSF